MRIASEPKAQRVIEQVLRSGVEEGTFPGAVACIAYRGGNGTARCVLAGAGRLMPGGPAVRRQGPYDLASLTKPFVACSVLRLAARGALTLDRPIAAWLPELSGTLGGEADLASLLSHRAGLTPWGGLYDEAPGSAGSPEARAYMLREAATRSDPEPPAEGGHYSDLGYLLIGETTARAGKASLAEVVQREVTAPLGIDDEIFYAASLSDREREAWLPAVAPTELCAYRGRVVRGEVHDENCAAFGGVAGHAGLFGSARGVATLGLSVLDAVAGAESIFDADLMRWAIAPRPGGGYVAGWDTPSRQGSSSAGSRISARAFGHLGFTGTSLWCDPDRHVAVVLLSNRVHPTRDNIQIRAFRPRFHDRMFEIFDSQLRADSDVP